VDVQRPVREADRERTGSSRERGWDHIEQGRIRSLRSRAPHAVLLLVPVQADGGAIRTACGGRPDVILEMTGGPTTGVLLDTLAPFGRLVVFGMAARQATEPIDVGRLMARSHAVVGFWLARALRDPARWMATPMQELLRLVTDGTLRCVVGGTYPLSEARRAHEDLRGRRTVGKLLLDVRA
jgi:NADPH2:quinone reductase